MNPVFYSTVGRRHMAKGRPCEDRSGSLQKNNVRAIAVADGAGSSKYDYAADGAECVVNASLSLLCNNFDKFYEESDTEKLSAVVIKICRDALQKKADELGIDSIGRMASTLLVLAVKEDKVIICHLGDGLVGRLSPNGAEVLSAPENGEFAGTTFFVTMPGAANHLRILKTTVRDSISFFMMTDGTADYLLNGNGTLSKAAEMMAKLASLPDGQEQLERILKEKMIAPDANSDDCSYACLHIGGEIPIYHKKESTAEKEKKQYESTEKVITEKKTGIVFDILILLVAASLLGAVAFAVYIRHKPDGNNTETTSECAIDELSSYVDYSAVNVSKEADNVGSETNIEPSNNNRADSVDTPDE